MNKPIDVIVWANAPQPPKPGFRQRIKQRQAAKRYAALRSSLERFKGSGIRVKTAFQKVPEGTSINTIRADYMEAASLDALQEGCSPDHPIIWLDADTTYVTKDALNSLGEKVREGNTLFVHANERYTTEWAEGVPLSKRDVATKVITIDELHRRKYAKLAAKQGKRLGYPEESGLAFKVGTYLKLGGLNRDKDAGALGESAHLLAYGKQLLIDGRTRRDPFLTWQDVCLLPKEVPGLIEYMPSARIGISARRLVDKVREKGMYGIWNSQQGSNGQEYELHSTKQSKAPNLNIP